MRREIEAVADRLGASSRGATRAFRRRHADHHLVRGARGTDRAACGPLLLLRPDAGIAVEVDPRGWHRHDRRARPGRRHTGRASAFRLSIPSCSGRSTDADRGAGRDRGRRASARRRGGHQFDLIYGCRIRRQSCRDGVTACLEMAPDRFAVFGYAHIPGFKKHQRMIDESVLPDGEARPPSPKRLRNTAGGGYKRIGLDHYARQTETSRRPAERIA